MHTSRLAQLRTLLKKTQLDAVLIADPTLIFYLTAIPHFSREEREAYLLITVQNAYLFTDARYSDGIATFSDVDVKELSSTTPLRSHLQSLLKKEFVKKVGYEATVLNVAEFDRLQNALPSQTKFTPIELDSLRELKDQIEINAIEKACQLADQAMIYAWSKIREGISEEELASEITLFFLKNHAENSFPPIVAFGSNAAIPHHHSGKKRLKHGDAILIDLGAKLHQYCSDMTRTAFFGNPSDKHRQIYDIVKQAQQQAFTYIESQLTKKKNILAHDVDEAARNYIRKRTYPSIPHALGHGIGIHVHELPSLSPQNQTGLKTGMVFSLEPGIYLPREIGVRIEDIVVLKKNKAEYLTHTSRDLVIL